MKTFQIEKISEYKNNGQAREQDLRFALTNKIEKADNRPASECADCNGIQIKSARATICKGRDIRAHIENDTAKKYAYVTKDNRVFLMDKKEYITFCTTFATVTTESAKNGGAVKTRLKHETPSLLAWLIERVNA